MIRNCGEMGIMLQRIFQRLQANQNLLKLLYYTDKDPYSKQDLTKQQIEQEVYEKLIKIIPRVGPKETAQSLIAIRVVNASKYSSNADFNEITIAIEVFVPLTQWFIKDSNLRPFAIMGEIEKSLNNKVVDGMGRIAMGDFDLNFLTDEISCYEMTFRLLQYD